MSELQEIIRAYPELAALVVLFAGIVLAQLVSKIVAMMLAALDQRFARYSASGRQVVSPSLVKIGRTLTFSAVVLIAGAFAVSLLDITDFPLILDGLFSFLGRLLFGAIILGAGHLLGSLAQGTLERVTSPSTQLGLISKALYFSIMFIAAELALSQFEIDTSFVKQLLLLSLALVLGGMMLAFALGAKHYVSNLLAQTDMQRYSVGEKIRIEGVQGTIMQMYATGLDLESDGGIVFIPASRFATSLVTRIAEDDQS
ncbi:MAG: hypothetical protein ACFHXK_10645 [bacterium]